MGEKLLATEQIHTALNDPYIRMYEYYKFLDWVLPKFTNLNRYFQKDNSVTLSLYSKMKEGYLELLLCYMQTKYVMQNDLISVDPQISSQYKSKKGYI
jgi:hypothetical protein